MNWYFNLKKLMLITFGNYMANNRDKDKRLDCCLNLSSFFKPLIKHSDHKIYLLQIAKPIDQTSMQPGKMKQSWHN